jgi:methylglutaconyl-CoA hydratase
MTSTDATLYELRGKAAWITLNQPESRNALSSTIMTGLESNLRQALDEPSVRCIVITGSGSAFCAGADLMNRDPTGPRVGPNFPELLTRIVESPKPVIAAVNGAAFAGGLGLVGASDIVIVCADAPFSFSEVRIGVIPAIIAVVCVPKLGAHQATKLFLTGERFNGARAVELGLAHRAVDPKDLDSAVQEQIDAISLGAPSAIRECKKLVRRAAEQRPIADAFKEMEEWSKRMFAAPEGQEGVAAFREKRRPSWTA